MVTHVIFDIDGTLIDESEVLDAQVSAVAWKFGDSLEAKQAVVDAFFAANDRAISEGGVNKNNILQYMKWIGESLSIRVSDEEAEKLATDWSVVFQDSFTESNVFLDSKACLEDLKAQGLTLIAASGGSAEKKRALLHRVGLASFFSSVYGSTDVGFQKQDIRFWQELLRMLNVGASACVVVGNQINDDIMHPKTLGMGTVLVERVGLLRKDLGPKDVHADHIIKNLDELITLIG